MGFSFPLPSGPGRSDRDPALLSCRVVTEATPSPVFGLFYEAAGDGVAVYVFELLDALVFCVDIEVVIALLPETVAVALQFF